MRGWPFVSVLVCFTVTTIVMFASEIMPYSAYAQQSTARIANPASTNCEKLGGTLSLLKRGDGGEYGLCVFKDGRQCEEWALFRGECPEDGIDTTGYATPEARYCAVTGGKYQATGIGGTNEGQGTCIDRNGRTCDAWAYFRGECGLRR